MYNKIKRYTVCVIALFTIAACSDGSSSSKSTSDVSIRFSDAPIGDLSNVVLTVDKLIFNRAGEDILVDTFTSDELGIEESDTFQIDLLEVQGLENRLVLDSVILPVGDYQNLRIVVLDENLSDTYVNEVGGSESKPLKVPSSELKLGSFTVGNSSTQSFVVEFGLNQAMTYNPGPDRYILKPRGVRIVRLENAASISGTVDLTALHLLEGCSDKADISVGNVAYLYSGHDLDESLLGDVFIREDDSEELVEFDENVAANIIQPNVSVPIDGATGEYLFSYLNPGDYTLAISCQSAVDDPVIYDEIVIPSASGQVIEVSLASEAALSCDFPDPETCSSAN